MSLDHEAEERPDARAAGLHRFVTSFIFVATLLLLCDILPLINRLSVLFQTSELDFAIGSAVKSTVKSVQAQQEAEGPQLARLDSYIHKLEAADIHITLPKGVATGAKDVAKARFNTGIKEPFLTNVIMNLEARFEDDDIMNAFSRLFNTKAIMERHVPDPLLPDATVGDKE